MAVAIVFPHLRQLVSVCLTSFFSAFGCCVETAGFGVVVFGFDPAEEEVALGCCGLGVSTLAGFAAGAAGLIAGAAGLVARAAGLVAGAAGLGAAGLVGAAFAVDVFGWDDGVVVVLVADGVGVGGVVACVNLAVALLLAALRLVTKAESKWATAVAFKAAINASSGGASKNAQHIPKIAAA